MDFIEVAEDTMIGDLMRCIIEQVKVLPKPWEALSEAEQEEYLNRVDLQVSDAVRQAVRIIVSRGCHVVPAKVDTVTYKDGCKVVLKAMGQTSETIHIAEAEGHLVSIVIPVENEESDDSKPKPDPDQRAMDLGHEYDESGELENGFSDLDEPGDDFGTDETDDGLDHTGEYDEEESAVA